jgi:hypothetical protein
VGCTQGKPGEHLILPTGVFSSLQHDGRWMVARRWVDARGGWFFSWRVMKQGMDALELDAIEVTAVLFLRAS